MSSLNAQLYSDLYTAVKARYNDLSKKSAQQKANELWNEYKTKYKNKELKSNVESLIKKLKEEKTARKSAFTQFFVQAAKAKPSSTLASSSNTEKNDVINVENAKSGNFGADTEIVISEDECSNTNEAESSRSYNTPAQDNARKRIHDLEKKLQALEAAKNSGLGSEETDALIKKYTKEVEQERIKLKRKMLDVERQKKSRTIKKARLKEACAKNPEVANILKIRSDPGRPRIEEGQPELLESIIDIAMFGSGADDRRRTELIRSCKSLSDLHNQLKILGFELSRSALYLRLIPLRSNSVEGKRHVKTVPVKLISAQTSEHTRHIDTEFSVASIRALESLASLLGPKDVFFVSQDDKARIPLGITAAQKQQAILMHVDYRVKLPDHDWVKAKGHKLIPSVYAGIVIKENGMGSPEAVTYSGPTYIAIRSGKHSSSTALTHANDFEKLLEMDMFDAISKTKTGDVKPVIIISVDGGPDENPRYDKVIKIAIQHFKKYNLDALFVVTNAPGRSAYNRVKRRMAPLSHEFSGLLLPHDHFGSHLGTDGKTIDEDLEVENFKYAGEVLSEVWNNVVIDGFGVKARYIEPGELLPETEDVEATWYQNHVRESQYLLQISKCTSKDCCTPHRSNLRMILPNGFLPPPMKMSSTSEHGLQVHSDPAETGAQFMSLLVQLAVKVNRRASGFKQVPYDLMCPSLQSRLSQRVCETCGLYFASQKSVIAHKKRLHIKHVSSAIRVHPVQVLRRRDTEALCILRDDEGNEDAECIDVEEVESIHNFDIPTDMETRIPCVEQIGAWLTSPWSTQN